MSVVAEMAKPLKIGTMVSLNTIMVDGTVTYGSCRATAGGETMFVCVDGPEFDAPQVAFDNMIMRLGMYRIQEKKAHEKWYCEK